MILQACPQCARQFDITHVPVGRRLRCACDALITVRVPTEVTVRARKCGNCGGPIEPGERACGYCASKLVELDLDATLCPSCFKRVEGGARHCQGCGTRLTPQALYALADGIQCPRCEGELRLRSLGEASVVECTGCEGLWVPAEVFDQLCKLAHERPEQRLAGAATEVAASGLAIEEVRYIPCLTCSQFMLRRNFRYGTKSSHVVIDFCQDHGVWLDHQELERLMAFIRERAGSSGPSAGGGAVRSEALEHGHTGRLNTPEPVKPGRLPDLSSTGRGGGFLDDFTLGSALAWILGDLF